MQLPNSGNGGPRRAELSADHARKLSLRYEDHVSDLVALLSAADELVTAMDLETLFRRALELARESIGLERVSIYLQDDSGQVMRGTWGTDLEGRTTDERAYAFAMGEPEEKAQTLLQEGRARWLIVEEAALMHNSGGAESVFVRTGWLAVTPIRSNRGPVGVMYNDTAMSGMAVDTAKQELATILCSLVASIVERKRVEEQLLRRSMYDEATGLPSQALFLDRLQRLSIQGDRDTSWAVVSLSLDRWSSISESYSPHVYEAFLSIVSQRLQMCLRTGDTASRLSSYEFALLLDPLQSFQEAESITHRILGALARPMTVEGEEIHTTASAGISLAEDSTGDAPEELLQNARGALARAKNQGPGRVTRFQPADRDLAVKSIRLESELHRAVSQGDFLVHYQPLVQISDGSLHGFEALVRWIHPSKGVILPGLFIPMAEENGLIAPIGEWVLEEASRQAGEWRKEHGGRASGVTLSVNLSVRQFNSPDLVERVEAVLDRSGMPPRLIHLEITESAVMEDPDQARHVLSRLKSLGVLLSLDDFGTGFSSFSYLSRLPLDALKIDRSFVVRLGQDARTEAVVRAICDLARDLGMEVVAEGVETQLQLEALKSFSCQYVQGFLVSRPLDAEAAGLLINQGAVKLPDSPLRNSFTKRMPLLPD